MPTLFSPQHFVMASTSTVAEFSRNELLIMEKDVDGPSLQERATIFISYAREDSTFARKIAEALKSKNILIRADWDLIPGPDYEPQIRSYILSSDAFLFVISPDSVISLACQRELELAAELKKRILPLSYRYLGNDALLHPALRKPQWILLAEDSDFNKGIEELSNATFTDFDLLPEHGRLLIAADNWEQNSRDRSYLLRGSGLRHAEEWLSKVSGYPEKLPQPTPLISAYILASQNAQSRSTRITFGIFTAVILVLAVLTVFAFRQRNIAIEKSKIALARQLAAQALGHVDDLDRALLLTLEANRIADELKLRTVEFRSALLTTLKSSPYLSTFLHGHSQGVNSVAFSPDGMTLASGSDDGAIILWDIAKHQSAVLRGHKHHVAAVAFSPDRKTLASASDDKSVILWDIETHRPIATLQGHSNFVNAVAFSPDGTTLASGSTDHTIILWDVATRKQIGKPLMGHKDGIMSVAFSPDGKTLASGSHDYTVMLWHVATGKPMGQPLTGHVGGVYSISFTPDGKTLASGSRDGTVILWDIAARKPIRTPLTGHTSWVNTVAFSPDGKWLVSGSLDHSILRWDVETGQVRGRSLLGHGGGVRSLAFSPDGQTFASGGDDGAVILWHVRADPPLTVSALSGHSDWVNSLVFSPNGKTLATGSQDNTIILWDVATGKQVGKPLIASKEGIMSVAFSPDGKMLASGSWDKTIALWDVVSRQTVGILTGHSDGVLAVAFSPDGKFLASGSKDKTGILWDVAGRQSMVRLTGHTGRINSVAFSSDGKVVVLGSGDGFISKWDMRTMSLIDRSKAHSRWGVMSVAFSADGKAFASGGSDGMIKLMIEAIPKLLSGHTEFVNSVSFSPNSQILASGSDDRTIILWDVLTGRSIGSLTGHGAEVYGVAFAPDGKTLASGSRDSDVFLWDVDFNSWKDRACATANRNLTREEWRQYLGDDEPYRNTCPKLPAS